MPKNVKDRMEFMREARERFTLAQHADKEDRQEAIDETMFAAGEQWDEEARFARVAQNRPVMTWNRCGGFTQQVVNDGRENKPPIKSHHRWRCMS